jgi:hypothetical protein
MIIAVVFNSVKHQESSNIFDTTKNLFDAYYADATNATKIVPKGNLPPQLEITSPQKGKIYVNGQPILERFKQRKLLGYLMNMSLHNITILLGEKIITVTAADDSKVAKVEFYIDETLEYTDTQAPYEYTFSKISPVKSILLKTHVLKVIVYDDTGKTNSAEINFKARI